MIIDTESKFGTLIYDKDAEIKLSTHIRSFQVKNTVFSLKLIKEWKYKYNDHFYFLLISAILLLFSW